MQKTILLLAGLVWSVSACDGTWSVEDGADENARATVFQNVRVLPMSGAGSLEGHSVIVEGARIAAIGPTSSTPAPEGARLIDGSGLTLMPGLADMHVHYWNAEEGALFVVNGITTVRNLWGAAVHFRFDTHAKGGDMVGPHVYTTGPLIDGPNPVWGDFSVLVESPEAAEAVVDAQFATGYAGIKLYEMLSEESYRAAVLAAKARGMKVSSHTPGSMTVEDLLALEIDSIEHLDGYAEALSGGRFDRGSMTPRTARLELWNHADEAAMEPLARRTAEAKVWNVVTLNVYTQLHQYAAEAEDFLARNEIRYVPPETMQFWRNAQESAGPAWAIVQEGEGARARFVKALFDAGAPLLVGTDTPNPFITPGYAIHDELDNLSKTGIPNDALLRMATTEAARYLDAEGKFGIVAEGARADLILVAGDPLTDLSVLRQPVGVMVNGHWRTREELIEVLEANAVEFERARKAEEDPRKQ